MIDRRLGLARQAGALFLKLRAAQRDWPSEMGARAKNADVAIALANGVEQVDAVEIDPLIAHFGTTLNPDKPYDDPRVKVYVEDGRTFLRNTNQQYDLIIYALPDSLTLTSAYSSLRLESFLLTTESLQEAKKRLTSDGLVVLYNYYREEWLGFSNALATCRGVGEVREAIIERPDRWNPRSPWSSAPGSPSPSFRDSAPCAAGSPGGRW